MHGAGTRRSGVATCEAFPTGEIAEGLGRAGLGLPIRKPTTVPVIITARDGRYGGFPDFQKDFPSR